MQNQEAKVPPYEISSVAGNHSPPSMQYQTPAPVARPVYGFEEYPGVRYYPTPVPLRDLGHLEALVDCPYCGGRGTTRTRMSSGNMNQ
ncbi:hypothetical protein H2200_001063 [Cladophialophora chaetospira]|uniref:LITAF domain-containing protein n=1 Tax=Cladophialophora chaetospira TaxID=386627 RepID=A0AA38XK67_9EURO|nr:hypothetical protein H2200_001063 [Cladophialophora chaetospira]